MKKNVKRTEKLSNAKRLNEGDIMPKGKYKGRTIIEILVSDPQYILWAQNAMNDITFNENTLSRASVKAKQKEDDFFRRRKKIDYEDEPLTANILGL